MSRNLYPLLFLVFSIIVSCETESNLAPTCKIIKYNKYSENENTILYKTELIWESNFITHRFNYGNILPSSTGQSQYGFISKDSITYNQNNLVERIYYGNRGNSLELYDLFYYNTNNPNPYKRENIRTYQNGYIGKWIENITYVNDKIVKTISYEEDLPLYPTTKDYTYDTAGNLIQTIETSYPNFNSFEKTETINYSNYDNQVNPFKYIDVPFVENRNLKYSVNNCRRISGFISQYNEIVSQYQWEITNLQYNSLGYPLICEYLCN